MKKKRILTFLVLFIFLFILSYFLPYTNDDWAWGSSIGINRLNNFFVNYNGRYLGNLLVLILTRYKIFKSLIVAIVFSLITYFVDKIIDSEHYVITLLICFLSILIPMPIFRQVFSWTSGFCNYVPPTFLILIYIYINKKNIQKFFLCIGIITFILGLSTTLFMEHLTIYIFVLSFVLNVYYYVTKKRFIVYYITHFIGVIIGSIIMFSNKAYLNIINGNDFYRSIPKESFILRAIKRYFATIYNNLFLNNVLILVVILISLIILYKKFLKNNKYAAICICINIFYTLYSLISLFFSNWELYVIYLKIFEGVISILYLLSLICFIIFLPKKTDIKFKSLFLLSSIIIMALPLLIVTPVTSRCFYPMYVFWMLFSVYLLDCSIKYINFNKYKKYIEYILILLLSISVFYYLWISFAIFRVSSILEDTIKKQKSSETLEFVLPKIPYEDYMKDPNPGDSDNLERFKLFYEITDSVKLKFIDYISWRDIINK